MKLLLGGHLMWIPKSLRDKSVSAGGECLSLDEYHQIIEHLEHCPSCRTTRKEFAPFFEGLPVVEPHKAEDAFLRHSQTAEFRQRFVERASAVGIEFSDALVKRCRRRSRLVSTCRWVAVAATLGAILLAVDQFIVHRTPKPSLETETQAGEQKTPITRDQTNRKLEAKLKEMQSAIESSQKEVAALRSDNSTMRLQLGALEKYLLARRAENKDVQRSLAHLNDVNAQLATDSRNNAQLLAQTKAALEESRARGSVLEAENAGQKTEIDTLSQQLSTQTASLARERELFAAGRDITDLMGARNLHIIDVRDADARGKDKRAFGRIFYTEGKSLIFYAYDLDQKKLTNPDYSFEVWGEQLGEPKSIRNLGILYTDNKEQKRWALKVDDPQQLAEIDSVFVTLESHQGVSRPRGEKVLFAFLGGKANHP